MRASADCRAIAARARTIYERVDSLRRQSIALADRVDGDALTALASWSRAFAPGNPGALNSRLAWDGMTPELVAAALDAPPDDATPAWTRWIDRIADAARALADDIRDSRQSTQNTQNRAGLQQPLSASSASSALNVVVDVPYAEIWIAVVRAAHVEVDPRLPARDRQLSPETSPPAR